jgi:serine/threonine protein kinase
MLDSLGHVKLVDFGLACALTEPAATRTGSAGVGPSAADALATAGPAAALGGASQGWWEEPMSLTGSLVYMAPELLERQKGGRHTDW